ncbi:dTDP-glucose 4,6-dehydratase [subsurface metagenome]
MNYSKFDLSQERILITGGCGFIGHHLATLLREAKCNVMVVDSLMHNNITYFWGNQHGLPLPTKEIYLEFLRSRLKIIGVSGCIFENIDSRNMSDLQNLFIKFKPTKVVHLAAIANAKTSNLKPDVAFDNSISTLKNALECIRLSPYKVGQLIFLSSSMVYGDFPPEGVYEDFPLNPKGIYGSLKLCAEQMILAYNKVYKIPFTIARPSALYGSRCVSRRVTSLFIENAIQGKPLEIEGDGEQKLDFTYIKDLIQGLFRIIIKPEGKNQTFNLTYGEHRTINSLAAIIKKHFPDTKIVRKKRDQLTPFRGTLKIDKAKKLLGYQPEYPLEIGYPEYINWYKEALRDYQNLIK